MTIDGSRISLPIVVRAADIERNTKMILRDSEGRVLGKVSSYPQLSDTR